jgi:hypothetical protein
VAIIGNVALMNPQDSKPLLVFSLVYLPVLLFCLFMSWSTTTSVRLAFYAAQEQRRRKQELSTLNQRLQTLASTDALTRVGNRRAFDVQLEEFWQHAQQHGRPFALLLVDIDYFKPYNDHYGHRRGTISWPMWPAPWSAACAAVRPGFPLWRRGVCHPAANRQPGRTAAHCPARAATGSGAGSEHHYRPDGLQHLTISLGAALSSMPVCSRPATCWPAATACCTAPSSRGAIRYSWPTAPPPSPPQLLACSSTAPSSTSAPMRTSSGLRFPLRDERGCCGRG